MFLTIGSSTRVTRASFSRIELLLQLLDVGREDGARVEHAERPLDAAGNRRQVDVEEDAVAVERKARARVLPSSVNIGGMPASTCTASIARAWTASTARWNDVLHDCHLQARRVAPDGGPAVAEVAGRRRDRRNCRQQDRKPQAGNESKPVHDIHPLSKHELQTPEAWARRRQRLLLLLRHRQQVVEELPLLRDLGARLALELAEALLHPQQVRPPLNANLTLHLRDAVRQLALLPLLALADRSACARAPSPGARRGPPPWRRLCRDAYRLQLRAELAAQLPPERCQVRVPRRRRRGAARRMPATAGDGSGAACLQPVRTDRPSDPYRTSRLAMPRRPTAAARQPRRAPRRAAAAATSAPAGARSRARRSAPPRARCGSCQLPPAASTPPAPVGRPRDRHFRGARLATGQVRVDLQPLGRLALAVDVRDKRVLVGAIELSVHIVLAACGGLCAAPGHRQPAGRPDSALLQLAPQHREPLVEPRLHRAQRAPEQVRNFLEREPVVLLQHDGRALILRQRAHRARDRPAQVAAGDRLVDALDALALASQFHEVHPVRGRDDRRAPLAPQPVAAEVERDPVQPRRELRLALEAAERAERAQECLLADVSRVLFAADRPVGEGEDRPLPPLDELVEALGVATDRAGDEFLVGEADENGNVLQEVLRIAWRRADGRGLNRSCELRRRRPGKSRAAPARGRETPVRATAPGAQPGRSAPVCDRLHSGTEVSLGVRQLRPRIARVAESPANSADLAKVQAGRMTIIDSSTDNPRRLMTIEEVIDYLRVNARTIYRLIQSGDLPAVRVGRQWRVRRGDLDEWLERGRPAVEHAPKP